MTALAVEIHRLDTRTGEWCDRCDLPSVVAVEMAIADADSLRTMSRFDVAICTDCGQVHRQPPRTP